ncbi:TDP-N-acetylfucosamine:lipid II N-acetylfucosaminyltransferase [Vibrio sp. S/42/10]|uniref:TDP-N-acetylfucosamine:lipid II N-acetylfucosaminyltransferase n=1 Tax=Vibrio sp. S/42/10 TaxID=2914757 RepID=UPI002469820B|nr:TDP-N-acetylfucosamine:lipid II N-acetylfucosaminyltransferase [Vibrio sp. S/42/10]MDH5881562.1 TDP-N-acetylfucosamine:lipid II N-acetylfucosaminyltransferase [Vibrio sp. S/42/10]
MGRKKTLHVACLEKFIPPFIELTREKLKTENKQYFYTYGDIKEFPYQAGEDSYHVKKKSNKLVGILLRYIPMLNLMYRSDKIVLHGLGDIYLILLLMVNFPLLKKCYWVIWGKDLYLVNRKHTKLKDKITNKFRIHVIKNIGHLVTYVPGDIELAREWCGAKGKYHECLLYNSNIYHNNYVKKNNNHESSNICNIQVGNSSNRTNNHIEAFDIISSLVSESTLNTHIYAPLSYGDRSNVEEVLVDGRKKFGNKFIPLTEFMGFSDYLSHMSKIDLVILNHDRQEAMGNAINFIGQGKKVYLKGSTTAYKLFTSLGLTVFDIDSGKVSLEPLDFFEKEKNIDIVKSYFSLDNLIMQCEKTY